MRRQLRLARPRWNDEGRIEDVRELDGKLRHGLPGAVGGKHRALEDRQRTQVIDAMHMVGVRVRKQHGVDPIDAGRHELEPQLGRGVDQETPASGLDERSRARAFVAGVGGCTG